MIKQNNTITPERQMQAQQVGSTFNSFHQFLSALAPVDTNGVPQVNPFLQQAHVRLDEAAMWAIKSVLNFGAPVPEAAKMANDAPSPDADAQPDPLPTDNAGGTEAV